MINIEEQTDSLDGKKRERQIAILIVDIGLLALSFILIMGFEYLIFSLAGYSEKAFDYIENILPFTFLVWALAWLGIAQFGFVNPKGNHIQATHNPISPERLPEGGTQFIIYQTGWALKYLWEQKQGPEIQIENEVNLEGDLTTVSIKKIALEMKLSILYRVYLPRLSSYLQNRVEANGMMDILKQLKAACNQYIEEAASKKTDTEEVRGDQTGILTTMLGRICPEALHYGINILRANFSKCDYSIETQKELNKILEARGIKQIADEMGLDDKGRALELAAVAAGKPGAKVTRTIFEVVMTPEVADAAKAAGPAAAVLFAAGRTTNTP